MASTIRIAKSSDLERLLPLVAAYYKFDSIAYDEPVARKALRKLLRERSLGRVWVIDSGAGLHGHLILTYNYDLEFGGIEGIITDFFILPEFRRQGFGARMIETVREFCRGAKIVTIELQVLRENKAAQSFYRKLGFKAWNRIVMSIDVG